MTPEALGQLALQLKKAKRASKPYFFFFLKEGGDGEPELLVDRKAEEARNQGRKAKQAASNKLFVRGRIEPNGDGGLGFFGEGKIPAAQVIRLFRQKLARAPELSSVAQLLKEATVQDLSEAPSIAAEGLQDDVGGMSDGEDEAIEEDGPTKEDWTLASAAARGLFLRVKERFGDGSEEHSAADELRQAALNAKNAQGFAEGIDGMALLSIHCKRLLGLARKPTLDWEAVASALQLAKKADRPFWFWYCRQGEDDYPVLVISRRRNEMVVAAKEARRTAQKKKSVEGWIEVDRGELTFWCEGTVPLAQVERDFRQRLAPIDDLSVVAPLLRSASIRDADEATASPDELAYADPAANDHRIQQALAEGEEEAFDRLTAPGGDLAVRVALFRAVWDSSAGAQSSALGAIGAILRDDPLLAAHPDGHEPLERIAEIEDWYVGLTGPVDEAFDQLGTHSFSEAAVLAALKAARKGLEARPELKALEATPLGSPALHSNPLAAIDRVVQGLTRR